MPTHATRRARPDGDRASPELADASSATTIVVADDDQDIRELVVFKLEQTGFRVIAVGDGQEALDAIRTHRPALAVLDVMMPGLSGVDVARAVRKDILLAGVSLIILTARAQEGDVQSGFSVGADDYVIKPFSPRELVSRVQAVLARARP